VADFSGNLLPALEDPISGVLNSNFNGAIVNLSTIIPIYRGRVGGEYVYSLGSAPVGATDVVIVGYT